jgi:DNA polymerase
MSHPFQPKALTLPRMVVDFETRSELNVKDVGAWRYAEHHSTEILCLGWKHKGKGRRNVWVPGREPFPQEIVAHALAGYTFEAHNVQFERAIWYHILRHMVGVEVPPRWVDTLASCAYRSLPLGLDKVGPVLGLDVQKDKRGKYLLDTLSKPRKLRKAEKKELEDLGVPPEDWPTVYREDPDLLEELYDYCGTDVEAEDELGETIGDLPPSEFRLWVLDQTINYRGVAVDLDAVTAAWEVAEIVTEKQTKRLQEITGGEVQTANQRDLMLTWFARQGYPMADMKGDTVDKALAAGNAPQEVGEVLRIRKSLSKGSTKKLVAFYRCTCQDGRIRGLLQYHGAGTGRWAGRLVQPQNFPRGSLEDYAKTLGMKEAETMELLIECIKMRGQDAVDAIEMIFGDVMEALATALRGMFIAGEGKRFLVADFSAIEAVVLAWLADETWKVDAFAAIQRGEPYGESADIYCATASMVFGYPVIDKKQHPKERQVGKTCELAFGYQGGVGAWYNFDDSGKYSDEEINGYKIAWRERHPNIVNLWYRLQDAAIDAVRMWKKVKVGNCSIWFEPVEDEAGKWLTCVLPNGRRLWYYNPHTVEVTKFGRQMLELRYEGRDNKKGGAWGIVSTYGGMLAENVVQAISRDLMAEAMVRVEKAGYPTLLTIHDEIIAEVPVDYGSLKDFEHHMALPVPPWAEGCPIAVDGWEGKRYMKA